MRGWKLGLLGWSLFALASVASAAPRGRGIALIAPLEGQLSLVGPVPLELRLPPGTKPGSLELRVDGNPVAASGLALRGRTLTGLLEGLSAGRHTLTLNVAGKHRSQSLSSWFELVELENPEQCEVLNNASCVLPFPSSRFLERARTRTGYRVAFGPETLPVYRRLDSNLATIGQKRIDPAPFLQNDGFSPTVQVLMHFPGGVAPGASDAPRLDPITRSYGTRGLEASSPTVLMDWRGGRRVNHWIENDARALDPERVVTFLRPGESLLPGHRYIVAVRNLVGPGGAPVEAEPVFAAIRDRRPSDIPAVQATRRRLEPVLRRLAAHGVAREELILAFDFVVASDHGLVHEMLSMRDQAFAWLAEQTEAGVRTFTVDEVIARNASCAPGGSTIWREVRGTFQVPLFLTSDPFGGTATVPGFLQRDDRGRPLWSTLTDAPYGVAIPCSALAEPKPTLVLGHGLFGTGPGFVSDLAAGIEILDFVAGGTNWSGLSSPDISPGLTSSFIFQVIADVDRFEALPDRLRQGQLHALVLARMLKQGLFNVDPAFQTVDGRGVIDAAAPASYYGISLGGIMGTMFAALTPDVAKLNVDVPAINFSLLLQRATPFIPFQVLVNLINPDAMEQTIGFGLNHELWVRGEPAGYASHVTGQPLRPLPGSMAKQMLVTVALFDPQVANLGSQLLGRTLRLPVLEGSVMRGLAGMPDAVGPQDSAYVVYDTGSFDLENPQHRPFIPPIRNLQAQENRCDPHPIRLLIPASQQQLAAFLAPGGRIENFCSDGLCDASEPNEIPNGAAAPCDPLD